MSRRSLFLTLVTASIIAMPVLHFGVSAASAQPSQQRKCIRFLQPEQTKKLRRAKCALPSELLGNKDLYLLQALASDNAGGSGNGGGKGGGGSTG